MTTHKEALEAAYLAGFNASGEGYNGEYPFGDKMQDPAENPAWKKYRDNYIKEALAQPEQEPTYTSTQATKCAECGEHKHTPLRIDAMGGYVCLTCIDKKLGSLLGEFGYAQPEQEPVAYPKGDVVGPCICGSWPGGKCLKCPRITTPPQRTWVGLTIDEMHQLNDALNLNGRFPIIAAIEAKLKEKNA